MRFVRDKAACCVALQLSRKRGVAIGQSERDGARSGSVVDRGQSKMRWELAGFSALSSALLPNLSRLLALEIQVESGGSFRATQRVGGSV